MVVGWWPLLLISGLPVSPAGGSNPARGSLRQFRGSQPDLSRNPQPGGVWKAQQSGDSRPSPGDTVDEEGDWMRIQLEEEWPAKCVR